MAFVKDNLSLVSSVNGFGLYRYDTTDALTTVDNLGYINNLTDSQRLAVGDMIEVVVWNTAVRTGAINDVGRHVVMQVNATTGAVDLSNDLTSWAPATGD